MSLEGARASVGGGHATVTASSQSRAQFHHACVVAAHAARRRRPAKPRPPVHRATKPLRGLDRPSRKRSREPALHERRERRRAATGKPEEGFGGRSRAEDQRSGKRDGRRADNRRRLAAAVLRTADGSRARHTRFMKGLNGEGCRAGQRSPPAKPANIPGNGPEAHRGGKRDLSATCSRCAERKRGPISANADRRHVSGRPRPEPVRSRSMARSVIII